MKKIKDNIEFNDTIVREGHHFPALIFAKVDMNLDDY